VSFLFSVAQEILERLKQKRTKTATMLISAPKPIALQDHGEKILSKILRFLKGVTLATYKQEDGPPVRSAKFSKGFVRILLIRARACCGKNQAPARRPEPMRFGQLPQGRFPSHQTKDAARFSVPLQA
jgi:hypothetical protein